jgi:bacillithiol biosynthesis cysteine-adding enzyme BshC
VPVFWLATEDHDFEEIRNAVVQDAEGRLHTVTLEAELVPGAPMSGARLTDAIVPVIEEVSRLLGESEVTAAVREAYAPGETVGTAFAKLFARLFAEFGVVLLDASDPELHRIAAPIYKEAVIQAESLEAALVERGKALHAAGYHEQVKVTPSSTLLFGIAWDGAQPRPHTIKDGARTPIHRENGWFTLGREKLSREELLARVDSAPAQFSANVLLRPVVQDFLLPTVAYSGGPAEVAYFAQAAVVYERLLGRVTPVVPRFSATLVDARAQRLLKKYELSLTDVLHGPEHTLELIAERSLPSDLQSSFEEAAKAVDVALAKIMKPLQTLDPTLVGSAERAGSKMRYQLNRLRTRAANAEVRSNEIIARHSEHLNSALFPHKQMQERVITGSSFLARYGLDLLQTLYASTERECPDHQVVHLQ